ncbi:hypothetical protein BMS3Abin02_00899 [bacterium BMS3Abin02]|nr:hypothetical protein BMS3Abin02_00899 [bacterium BMS3Abin02]GBE21359.1 hypothetical protein BMS3Bbin01_00701 [bacterium BMS3Bbin01]HDH24737.1 hypothetical protein [Actinomycetota bacterium]HDL48537.1 hypothetical protein [Actinomycetota bacterium]
MMVRLWWFLLGAGSGAWGTIWLLRRMQRARAALAPANLAKQGALTVADVLAAGGRRLKSDHR